MAGEFVLAEMGFEFEVYPGERNEAACFIHKNYISKQYKDRLHWIMPKIRIRKEKKQYLKSQNLFFKVPGKKNNLTKVRKEDLLVLMTIAISKKINQAGDDNSLVLFTQRLMNILQKDSDEKNGSIKLNLKNKF